MNVCFARGAQERLFPLLVEEYLNFWVYLLNHGTSSGEISTRNGGLAVYFDSK